MSGSLRSALNVLTTPVHLRRRAGTSCILAVLSKAAGTDHDCPTFSLNGTLALLVYDYILSAGEEWTLIWGTTGRTIKPKVLYGMTRYSLIALSALTLSTSSSTSLFVSTSSCVWDDAHALYPGVTIQFSLMREPTY